METFLRKDFFGDLSCDFEGIELGLDDEMPVGERVDLLTVVEKFLRRGFVSSERTFFLRTPDVMPAVLERGFEPDAREPGVLEHFSVLPFGPCSTAKRNDLSFIVLQQISEAPRFDVAIGDKAIDIDYLVDLPVLALLDIRIEVDPPTVQQAGQMPRDARLPDSHKAGQHHTRTVIRI